MFAPVFRPADEPVDRRGRRKFKNPAQYEACAYNFVTDLMECTTDAQKLEHKWTWGSRQPTPKLRAQEMKKYIKNRCWTIHPGARDPNLIVFQGTDCIGE